MGGKAKKYNKNCFIALWLVIQNFLNHSVIDKTYTVFGKFFIILHNKFFISFLLKSLTLFEE